MLCFALARPLFSRTAAAARRRRPLWLASYSTGSSSSSGSGPRESGKSDPLRILFCGSDEFSCASLRALHDEHKRDASLIRSIDVVVRPSKPTGRGYKVLREGCYESSSSSSSSIPFFFFLLFLVFAFLLLWL